MAWPSNVTAGSLITAAQMNGVISALSSWGGSVNANSNTVTNVVVGSGWNLNSQSITGAATFSGALTFSGQLIVNNSLGISITPTQALTVNGGVNTIALATPGAPTVTPNGTTGAATWTYKIVAKQADGTITDIGAAGSTATGNATLTSTNKNVLTWTAVTNAATYDVYRTVSGGTPSSLGKIGTSVVGATFTDTGIVASGSAPTTLNATGSVGIATTARQQLSVGNNLDIYSSTTASSALTTSTASIRAAVAAGFTQLVLNAAGTGGVFINYDSGTGTANGSVYFCNGAGSAVASISANGLVTLGYSVAVPPNPPTVPALFVHTAVGASFGVRNLPGAGHTGYAAIYGASNDGLSWSGLEIDGSDIKIQSASNGTVAFSNPAGISFGSDWQSWTPTVAGSGTMSIASMSVTDATYIRIGAVVHFKIYISGTFGGVLTNYMTITLPGIPAGPQCMFPCYVWQTTWFPAMAFSSGPGSNVIQVFVAGQANFTNTTYFIILNGTYRAA